jgi:hypothetical protein
MASQIRTESFQLEYEPIPRQLEEQSKDFSTPANSGPNLSLAPRCEAVVDLVHQRRHREAHKWEGIRSMTDKLQLAEPKSYLAHRRAVAASMAALRCGFTV